ncbi:MULTISPECIES: hypothetical protein [unclassified Pseudoalteromonas]|uniref:hypothetical protein n=1 Tax=unclassified Pseudoalteromonas TaxID=194690 RepID=UPI0030144AF0
MKKIIALVALGVSSFAVAKPINTQALQACAMVENDLKRLMCYDNVMANKPASQGNQKMAKQPGKPAHAMNKAQSNNKPEKSASITSEFGLEHKIEAESRKIDEISAKLVKVERSARKRAFFTLDNGQVWKQVSAESFFADPGDTLVIKRASFGSFLMKKEGSNRSTRVKRVD